MKTKLFIICAFALFLISLSIFELNLLSSSIADISESSKQIINQIVEDNTKTEILENMNNTYNKWKKNEYNLCLIYNHKDLIEIGKELNQAISYVNIGNPQEAYVHMLLLTENLTTLEQMVSFDLCNIF